MSRTSLCLGLNIDTSSIFAFISEMLGWIVTIGTLLGFFLALYATRAKIVSSTLLTRYIDFQTNEMIEEKEYYFSWGRLRAGKVALPKFPRNSTLRVFYKPRIAYKQTLPHDHYEEIEKGSHRSIKLVGKDFFDKTETECVYLQVNTPQGEDYKGNITREDQQNCIVITNQNREEIRNYILKLPPEVGLEDLPKIFEYISLFVKERDSSKGMTVILKSIPPMQGDTPGKVFIPLRKC